MNKIVCIGDCHSLVPKMYPFYCYKDNIYEYVDCGTKAIAIYENDVRVGFFRRVYFISLAEYRDEQIDRILGG